MQVSFRRSKVAKIEPKQVLFDSFFIKSLLVSGILGLELLLGKSTDLRGAVVEWLEQLGYSAESRHIA